MYYRLDIDGKTPIPSTNAEWWEWGRKIHGQPVRDTVVVWSAEWCNEAAEAAAINLGVPHLHVSTVFLGIDQGVDDGGLPVLWETATWVRGLEVHKMRGCGRVRWHSDDYRDQYSSHADALAGHERLVELARRLIKTCRPSESAASSFSAAPWLGTWDDLHLNADGTLHLR